MYETMKTRRAVPLALRLLACLPQPAQPLGTAGDKLEKSYSNSTTKLMKTLHIYRTSLLMRAASINRRAAKSNFPSVMSRRLVAILGAALFLASAAGHSVVVAQEVGTISHFPGGKVFSTS